MISIFVNNFRILNLMLCLNILCDMDCYFLFGFVNLVLFLEFVDLKRCNLRFNFHHLLVRLEWLIFYRILQLKQNSNLDSLRVYLV